MNVSEEQEESCCHDRNVQRGEVPGQLEALYCVLVTKSVEKPSGGSGVTHHNHADCEPVDTRRRRHPESLDVGGKYGIADEACEVVEGWRCIPITLAPYLSEEEVNEGQRQCHAPERQEEFHAPAACRYDPRREHGCDQVDRHQHVDEPQMADFGAVVDEDLGDVEQGGVKSDGSLRVVIEGVDCAPDHEGNQYAGEALPEEFTLIFDGKKEESGNHDE